MAVEHAQARRPARPRPRGAAAGATLESRSATRDNTFDLLRLVAAALVLISHSFPLAGSDEPTMGNSSPGGVGVIVFFAISGFLVTRSWTLQPRLVPFALKRALRLMPALAVTVVLSAYVLGPIVTGSTLGSYFASSETHLYVFNNLRLASDYDLPGVFATTPFPGVNGSLWTLPIEVKAYALLALIGLFGILRWAVPVVVLVVLLVAIAWSGIQDWTGALELVARALRRTELGPTGFMLIGVFFVSAMMCLQRARIPMRGWLCAVLAVGFVASLGTVLETPMTILALPYVVLWVGLRPPGRLRALTRPGDVSYGLYLWAFPIQQCIVLAVGSDISPLVLIVLALPVTYVVAWASWRLVEAPSLRLKPRVAVPLRVPS
jgi:peptidoglycan/LPS O-acetylase OafA/YrhL